MVPAIPSFSVDQGFRYRIPPDLSDRVTVGSLVRVPLSGRRVRGFVVEVEPDDGSALREIAQLSGRSPVFDEVHLSALRWCAVHYIAPLSVVLERTAPPNNPPAPPVRERPVPRCGGGASPIADRLTPGRRRTVIWLTASPDPGLLCDLAAKVVDRGEGVMVVAPTAVEVDAMCQSIERVTGAEVLRAHGDMADREITRAWSIARHHPTLLVGTPRIAAWSTRGLSTVVLVEEGRRAMKDRQTPTIHARDIVKARAAAERLSLVFAGPTPSVEVVAAAPEVVAESGRLWPLVEVVDRNDQPPGGGLLTETARRALQSVTGRGGRSFVFAHRRGYAAAVRCVGCREIRICPGCGSRPDPGDRCSRCGAELAGCSACDGGRFEPLGAGVGRLVEEARRVVGARAVGPHPFDGPVSVGTERDLVDLDLHDLVVFTDLDGILFGVNYRAAEECLRIGARLAGSVRRGSGRRLLIQTTVPGHPVVTALRRADPLPALRAEAESRAGFGYPPGGQLIVFEIRGDIDPGEVEADLSAHAGAGSVMGPVGVRGGVRWLVQGRDLSRLRTDIRPAVQRWRDGGAAVRIDVDPIDL